MFPIRRNGRVPVHSPSVRITGQARWQSVALARDSKKMAHAAGFLLAMATLRCKTHFSLAFPETDMKTRAAQLMPQN